MHQCMCAQADVRAHQRAKTAHSFCEPGSYQNGPAENLHTAKFQGRKRCLYDCLNLRQIRLSQLTRPMSKLFSQMLCKTILKRGVLCLCPRAAFNYLPVEVVDRHAGVNNYMLGVNGTGSRT